MNSYAYKICGSELNISLPEKTGNNTQKLKIVTKIPEI